SEVTLGFETDTQDIDGEILRSSKKRVSNKEIVETFNKFHGDINQTPPMYSAVRYKGKKLYELARKNVIVKREPRSVRIETLDIIKNQNNKKIIFKTECSKGTYIRTLCNDIGRTLGTYGYMSYLIRTGVGEFRIEDSLSVDYLKLIDRENIENLILPMDKALNNLDKIILEEKYYKPITNGVMVEIQDKNDYDLNIETSKKMGLRSGVLLFDTHTRLTIEGKSPPIITSKKQKLKILEELGVDIVYIIEFDKNIMSLSPEDFIKEILLRKLNAKSIC